MWNSLITCIKDTLEWGAQNIRKLWTDFVYEIKKINNELKTEL